MGWGDFFDGPANFSTSWHIVDALRYGLAGALVCMDAVELAYIQE